MLQIHSIDYSNGWTISFIFSSHLVPNKLCIQQSSEGWKLRWLVQDATLDAKFRQIEIKTDL